MCKKIWWIMSRVCEERWNIANCRPTNILHSFTCTCAFQIRVLLQLYIQLYVLPINKGEASIYELRTYNPPPTSIAVMLHQLHHVTTTPTCNGNCPKTVPLKKLIIRQGGPTTRKNISAIYLLLWGIDVGSFFRSNLFGAGVKVTSSQLCSSSWTLNFKF